MFAVPFNEQTWLICGGRHFADEKMFNEAMSALISWLGCPSKIVHGGASGADTFAEQWATKMAIDTAKVTALWSQHGKSAGPLRNQAMLDEHDPSVVVAFPGGRGTADMVRRAKAGRGIRVVEIRIRGIDGLHDREPRAGLEI